MQPFENNPFFHFFFNGPHMPHKFKQEMKGIGSGIIMDPQGHILTNNHVAGGASDIQVTLADGRQFPAKVVGTDPKTDLAVLKIQDSDRLPYLAFGDSDKVGVGEWVVAIGAPRGLDQTVTQGIISAKHRTGISDPNSYRGLPADRRSDQPRQQRRAAAQPQRRSDRHQRGHRHGFGRLRRHRFCHPQQHGDPDLQHPDRIRQSGARLAGGEHQRPETGCCQVHRPAITEGRFGGRCRQGRPGGRSRLEARGCGAFLSGQTGCGLLRPSKRGRRYPQR